MILPPYGPYRTGARDKRRRARAPSAGEWSGLGKVRTRLVKRLAEELVYAYPDKFTTDYQHNKKVVDELVEGLSKRMRNKVAGYITHLISKGLISLGEEEAG